MGKIAFVFSGQGDQFPGMGKQLCEQYSAAAEVFSLCDSLREGTSSQCFEGSEDELKETKNTQPCLFAVEMAAFKVLQEKGIKPDMVAGFSLGEVVALTAAEKLSVEDGFKLVCKRGELMQSAAEKFDTSMAAVVKLPNEKVEELCSAYSQVYPVNYNCPGQVSVAGLTEQMPQFSADVKAAGGRAIPLKVKGAFHSPFMNGAAESFAKELEGVAFAKGETQVYSDVTAMPYEGDERELLSKQICSPVKFEKIVRNLIEQGADTFVEIGPGKTLINMIKKISADVKTYCTAEMETLLDEVK